MGELSLTSLRSPAQLKNNMSRINALAALACHFPARGEFQPTEMCDVGVEFRLYDTWSARITDALNPIDVDVAQFRLLCRFVRAEYIREKREIRDDGRSKMSVMMISRWGKTLDFLDFDDSANPMPKITYGIVI